MFPSFPRAIGVKLTFSHLSEFNHAFFVIPIELTGGLIVSSKGHVDVGNVLTESRDEIGQIFRSFEESLLSFFPRLPILHLERKGLCSVLHDSYSVSEISRFPINHPD